MVMLPRYFLKIETTPRVSFKQNTGSIALQHRMLLSTTQFSLLHVSMAFSEA
jgi:hypothetical protein